MMNLTSNASNSSPSIVGRILLVDDEPDQVALLRAMLIPVGLDVLTADSAEQALAVFRRNPVDVVVTDLHLPGASGIDLIRELSKVENRPAVVLITGEGSVASAVEALKLGASDYLQKPVDPMRLVTLLQELLRSDDVREAGDNDALPTKPLVFEGMVGASPGMREVFARIERVAPTGAPVLIVGESGTGKELVARAIHNRSRRSQGPFVPIHTGAIPKELVASELFGHEKGAFTGALTASEGKFEAAATGTVFLDEVGTMDLSTQISLLRVLETYRFTRVGANKERDADVRVVAATNRDLLDLVESNQFREDLYYRLNVFTIAIPPLRERREDVVPIAERFLRFFAKRYGTPARSLSEGALDRLLSHSWPGNVRELRNVMEQTAVFAQREVVGAEEVQFISTRLPSARSRSSAESRPSIEPARHRDEPRGMPAANGAAPAPSDVERPAAYASGDHPSSSPPPPFAQEASGAEAAPPSFETAGSIGAGGAFEGGGYEEGAPGQAGYGASGAVGAPAAAASSQGAGAPTGPSSVPGAAGVPSSDDHPLVLRIPVGTPLAEAERMLIIKTLEVSEGNKQRAARILGISRRGLYTKLAAYGEHVPAEEANDINGSVSDTPTSTTTPS